MTECAEKHFLAYKSPYVGENKTRGERLETIATGVTKALSRWNNVTQ